MKSTFKKRNNLPQQIQQQFGQSVQPTLISQSEFTKLFNYNRYIGEGTYGAVKCVQNCYNEHFAIKESKDNEQTYGIFRQVAIMKKFNHPNILKFIAFYQIIQSQKLIILTQFCKYKSLKDFSSFLSSLPQEEKYRLAVQIFSGLYAMHEKNIMHRDLKPDNILIDEKKHAKLCDFGFCRYDYSQDFSKSRKIGTPLYNSPETQKGVYTKKCDVFSYGLIVYFIFSNGKNVFNKATTNEELKSQRKQHFKNGKKLYRQHNFSEDIIELLENTINEKEQKRMDTKQIKIFWHKVLGEKNMRGLIKDMQESELLNNYQNITRQSQQKTETDSLLTNQQQKLAFQLIKLNTQNCHELQAQKKLINLLEIFKQISGLMKEFKYRIQETQLSKIEKQLIAYGFLYQLELKLQNLFQQCDKLYSKEKYFFFDLSLNKSIEMLFSEMIKKKHQLSATIFKIGNNLLIAKSSLSPVQLLSPIQNSFDELNKFQGFIMDPYFKETIGNLKKQQQILNFYNLFQTLKEKYKPNINQINFSNDFSLILSNYQKSSPQKTKLKQRQKIQTLFERLSKI